MSLIIRLNNSNYYYYYHNNINNKCLLNNRALVQLLLLLLYYSCLYASTTNAQKRSSDEIPRSFVNLNSLPEPFTNAKLPLALNGDSTATSQKCYSMIGCFEKLPITTLPQDPQDLKTQFRFYDNSGRGEALVTLNKTEVCLESKPTECNIYPYDLKQILGIPFDPRRRTIIVIGGYFSKAPSNWEVRVKDLWLQLDNVNVIIVGWVGGNSGLYSVASVNTRPVARQLTVLLYYLAQVNQMDLMDESFAERIYMIGHSLGAHISGFVGQDLGGKLGRITGLDPAGPQFDKLERAFRLDKSDAQLVDIMHTNAGSTIFTMNSEYGSALISGHIDFYANDGSHQPACSNDFLGCSHKKANAYYEAFLNHELAMREYLKCDSRSKCLPYRLRAYASETYEKFHDGTSLRQRCPITVLNDTDLYYEDLDKCSIPIDYVSWFDAVRDELQTRHSIVFTDSKSAVISNKYYYYPAITTDDQTDHYLLKIRIAKIDNNNNNNNNNSNINSMKEPTLKTNIDQTTVKTKNPTTINVTPTTAPTLNTKPLGCDFNLDIEMANGLSNHYVISKYDPIDEGDHYEVVVPFLSPNFVSKYELAKLDYNDFYLNANANNNDNEEIHERLRKSLGKVLPLSIKITGLSLSEDDDPSERRDLQKKAKQGGRSIFGFVKRLFSMAKEENYNDPSSGASGSGGGGGSSKKAHDPRCSQPIVSLTVLPLRKTHRHLSAFYSIEKPAKLDVIVLRGQNETSPRMDLIEAAAKSFSHKAQQGNINFDSGSNFLYIDKAIIGPYDQSWTIYGATDDDGDDGSFDGANDDSETMDDGDLGLDKTPKSRRSLNPHASMLSTKTWLLLACSSCIVILAMVIISVISMSSNRVIDYDDKSLLIYERQPSIVLSTHGFNNNSNNNFAGNQFY